MVTLRRRWRAAVELSKSAKGAFDISSIVVGVVLMGELTGGVLVTINSLVPYAQDSGAKQDLYALRTAEDVLITTNSSGRYGALTEIKDAGLLKASTDVDVETDSDGSCFVAISRSKSGSPFYLTDETQVAKPLTDSNQPGCLDATAVTAMSNGVGAPLPARYSSDMGMATFDFNGHEFMKRDYGTWDPALGVGPHFTGEWYSSLVTENPDGSLDLKMYNPSGSYPMGAQIISKDAYGYGTYQITVEGDFANFDPNLVFGSLLTYDWTDGQDGGHNEINAGEISNWNGIGVEASQNFFKDTGSDPVIAKETMWPAGVTQATVRLQWEEGRIVWDIFEGPDTTGPVIAHAVHSDDVPVPANETREHQPLGQRPRAGRLSGTQHPDDRGDRPGFQLYAVGNSETTLPKSSH